MLDLRDIPPSILNGFDAVVHLAALSNDPLGGLDPRLTHDINYGASVRLALQAKAAGVSRFLFASSCSLYGSAGPGLVAEDAPLKPLTPYGRSKVDVEEALAGMADDSFSPTFLRAATAYGVSPRLRGDVVVNNLVGSALTRGEIRLLGDGHSWRPLLHVEDMCRAFLGILEAPRHLVHAEAFNIVPMGENYQIRDIAEMVSEFASGCRIVFPAGGGKRDPRSYSVDGGKLASTLGSIFSRWNVREGIRELFAALGPMALREEDFFGPGFIRVERLRSLLAAGHLDADLRWNDPSRVKRALEQQGGLGSDTVSLPLM
jgi:nucleoside-diphosphate-sugar epimerase